MEAALEALHHMGRGRRVAVLGDMRELGPYAPEAHRRVGMQAAAMGVDVLILVGEWAREMAAGAASASTSPSVIQEVPHAREAARVLLEFHRPGDWILIKGSRAVGLEIVVEALRETAGDGQDGARGVKSLPRTASRRR
jgi:UDP-N-acetylmuramyl pentapeptide synthase